MIDIHWEINFHKYKQIVYFESFNLRANLKHGTFTACQQLGWIISGKLLCVLQYHLHSRLLSFVPMFSISYNFFNAHVLLTSLENWLLPRNNPISIILMTFKWHSMAKTNLGWQEFPSVPSWGFSLQQKSPVNNTYLSCNLFQIQLSQASIRCLASFREADRIYIICKLSGEWNSSCAGSANTQHTWCCCGARHNAQEFLFWEECDCWYA